MSKSHQENIDTISKSIETLSDGVWDWRDVKATGAILMAIGSLVVSAYALLHQPEPPVAQPEPVQDEAVLAS